MDELFGDSEKNFSGLLLEHGLSKNETVGLVLLGRGASDQIVPVITEAVARLSERSNLRSEILKEIDDLIAQGHSEPEAVQLSQRLRSVCMESLRFHHTTSILRRIRNDTETNEVVNGHRLQPNDTVVVEPARFAKNPKIVGENPQEFNPNRWIKEGTFWPNLPFLPFGSGRHMCPGWRLAVTQIVQMVYLMIRRNTTEKTD
ncbi:MAG: cytochrome P450 [Chlamydiales bacterium]|nr:cytochrome P450 [Chlamydiales bacterium]